MPPPENILEAKLEELERRFTDSAREIKELRNLLPPAAKREIAEIKGEWHGVHYKWWIGTLAGALFMFCLSYALYTKLGWVADQRALPAGNDWFLRHLPLVNTLPILSWGWFGLHLYAAGAAVAYHPRRIPFLFFLLTVYMVVRTAFVFLSPIGAPSGMVDMRIHDVIFSKILGTWTFTNEFVFSGHTSIPFLFFLFFKTPGLKRLMFVGSIVMAVSVLLSRNHYTVDVIAAFFMSYSVYALSRAGYKRLLEPLFRTTSV
ncbi:MAG: phosphatase PAP2-related protein [Elusimicrobiota bacterium]